MNYSWFIILRYFQVYSTVIQILFRLYSIPGCYNILSIIPVVFAQFLSQVRLSATPWTAACQAPLSSTTTTVYGAAKSQTRLSTHTRDKTAICLFLLSLYFFYVFAETIYSPICFRAMAVACGILLMTAALKFLLDNSNICVILVLASVDFLFSFELRFS